MKLIKILLNILLLPCVFLHAEDKLEVNLLNKKKNNNNKLLEQMLKENQKDSLSSSSSSYSFQKPEIRLLDLSLILQTAAGISTAKDSELTQLQTGAHDPRRRGFTFQNGEISLSGIVDPYFKSEMYALFSEAGVELEEAFLTTTSLPWKLELELGYFYTEFGRNNPRHPHLWDFIDQPLTVGRFFGSEGQRASGFRLGGSLPLPWLSEWHVGAQSPTGGLTPSFKTTSSSTVGGRPVVRKETRSLNDMLLLIRWLNGGSVSRNWEFQTGLSAMRGANNSGLDSITTLLGADFVFNWTSSKQKQGYPFLRIEGESAYRNFEAAAGTHNGLIYATDDLKDWVWSLQSTYGFKQHWRVGFRYEKASGKGSSFSQLRSQDSTRSDRERSSAVLTYKGSEFSKTSLQYNFDRADHLTDKNHSSLWLSFEVLIGSHPAHNF